MKLLSVQNPKSLVGSWIFTILWCGISFPLFYVFGFQERSLMGGAVGGLFTLIGIGMLYGTIKATLEYFKYGKVHLELEGAPPATGRSFSAKVNLPANAAAAGRISAELACVRVTWSRGSKGGTSKGEQDAWTRQQVFPARRSAFGGYAALRIEIPSDKPSSDVPQESAPDAMVESGRPADIELGRGYYRWELRIKADVPGIDFERTFNLRVAPGTQASSRPAVSLSRPSPLVMDTQLHERMLARRAVTRSLGVACAFVAMMPFVLPFAITGIAVGLAGCPMGWNSANLPVCEFAGLNWGRLMAGAFDLMFTAVPIGIGASLVIFVAGQAWLARDQAVPAAGSMRVPAAGAAVLVIALFVFAAWHRLPSRIEVAAVQPASVAGKDAARTARPSVFTGTWQEHGNDESRLKQALASVERSGSSDRPAMALAQYRLSLEYERQKRTGEQEQALLRALAILETYSDAEVKAELGASGGGLDKEIVARRLADIYWDLRRYDRAYDHYDRAYRYAREVQPSDSSLNLRLARNSAGRMVTACMLGNWDVADSAMAELKRRIVNVDAAERKRLDYWNRTGEPRLQARRC
jgi:tetratricopeptide (TPR) repeat protein